MFEPVLVAYLKSHSGLNGFISGRVYPARLPDPPTLPAAVYHRVSTPHVATMDGVSTEVEARFQLDAWARTTSEARMVANQFRLALLGFNGDMNGMTVQIPRMPQDSDSYEPETGLYRVITEFIIWHEEAQSA